MKKTTIICPLYLPCRKRRKDGTMRDAQQGLSMNAYRGWHFIVANKFKIAFKEQVRNQLEGKVFTYPTIEYFLYYKDNRRRDKMNFATIISKFLLDAMTEFNCIEDDCDEYVGRESTEAIGIDKDNPRCEVIITEFDNAT